jgi:hypothetical protein
MVLTGAMFVALALPRPAQAEPNWLIQPIQEGEATIRYVQGVPTVELEQANGVVRLTPLPIDHGSLTFTVAVFNGSGDPDNFGIENVTANAGGTMMPVLSKDELVKKAKNRAFWKQFGLALVGGVASGLAASQRDTYSARWVTPRGTYTSLLSTPSVVGQYQAMALANETAWAMGLVQVQLDRTILALGDEVTQLTTVDPGESYAGRLVIKKFSPKAFPAPVRVEVEWNGETYSFTFQLAKPGTPAPRFTALTRRRTRTDFRARLVEAGVLPPPGESRGTAASVGTPVPTAARGYNPTETFGNGQVHCETCRR